MLTWVAFGFLSNSFLLSCLLFLSLSPSSLFSSLPSVTFFSQSLSILHVAYLSLLFIYFLYLFREHFLTSLAIIQFGFVLLFFFFPSLFLFLLFGNFATQVTLSSVCAALFVWGCRVAIEWAEERHYPLYSYPLVGNLLQFKESFPRRHLFELDFLKTHGPSVYCRIGEKRGVWAADPRDVEYILKTNFNNFVKGKPTKMVFQDFLGDGIFNVDGHMWETQRKTASKEFSVSRFRNYMLEIFSEFSLEVMGRLEEAAIKKTPVDIQDLFFRYTFDSFGKLAFGLDVGCLAGEDSPAFAHAFDRANILVSMRLFDIFWGLKKLVGYGNEGELAVHLKTINEFVFNIVEERKKLSKEELSSNRDLLSRFMELRMEGGDPASLTQKDVFFLRDLVTNFMLAGRDTTASGLSWTIFHLFQSPSALERAREEINKNILEDPIELPLPSSLPPSLSPSTPPSINRPTYDQLKNMPYLHSVFSESLRLNPPVPADMKIAVNDDALPSGHKLDAGDIVTFFPYAMGRHPELWGKTAEEFVPERWLDEEGKFKRESPFKFSVFQAGPRQCLGIDFAYLEAKLILAMILQRFNLKLVSKVEDLHEGEGLTMSIKGGLEVMVERI